MQFLTDVFVRCPDCNGRRYRPHVLEVKLDPMKEAMSPEPEVTKRLRGLASTVRALRPLSIADLLDSTVEEAIDFLAAFSESRPAQRARASLALLADVGLGDLKLGQPRTTQSGGAR